MALGDIITAARYNNIQSRIETIMGNGSGTDGYGQVLKSSTVSVGSVVTAEDMQNLYDDMFAARVHQTGNAPTSIARIQVEDFIGENESDNPDGAQKGYTDFENLTPTIESDKFLVHPSQGTIEQATSSVRTTQWNGVIVHEFNVQFTSPDARRHFFNAGGKILFSATLIGSSGSKGSDWTAILNNFGTVSFGYTSTTSSGTGTGSAIGNYDLTQTYQQLFIKSGSGVYAENDYNISAKASTDSSVQFRVEFRDDDAGDRRGSGAAQDENVNGTITSQIHQFRPTGQYVSIPTPSYSNLTNI